LLDIVARDAFLDSLDDAHLRVRILEREPPSLDEALSLACRLEAYDKCAGVNVNNVTKSDADFLGMKPKYVKTAGKPEKQSDMPQNDVNSTAAILSQLDAIKLAVERCQVDSRQHQAELCAIRGQLATSFAPPIAASERFNAHWHTDERSVRRDGETVAAEPAADGGGAQAAGYTSPVYAPPVGGQHGPSQRNTGSARTYRPKGVCYTCGVAGHFARDHETTPKRAQGVMNIELGASVYLKAKLIGRNITLLLDTGCEENIMRPKIDS